MFTIRVTSFHRITTGKLKSEDYLLLKCDIASPVQSPKAQVEICDKHNRKAY